MAKDKATKELGSKTQEAIKRLEDLYGVGSVISSSFKSDNKDSISTGSISLDIASGIGGIGRGIIAELFGWESCGKSTITLQTIANAQKMGIQCLLVDGEHSFSKEYAQALGVDIDKLYIAQPTKGGEEGYAIAKTMMETGELGLVVIDSQTSLQPLKVVTGDVGESSIGLHARLMGQTLPKLLNLSAKHNCTVIFISQLREKVGVMYGSPETTSGGNALKFYAHMRLKLTKSVDKDAGINRTKGEFVKNKLSRPFGKAEFDVIWGQGIDKIGEIVDIGSELGIIIKSGSWYSYKDTKIGQGKDSVITFLKDNPEVCEEIKEQVLTKLKSN